MSNWLKLDYLFTNVMMPITPTVFRVVVGIYLLIFLLAIVFSILRRRVDKLYRHLFRRLANWCFSFSMVSLILLFFRHQLIPYLGMRGWTMVWWMICAIWMIYILKYLFFDIPKQKKEQKVKEEFEKYLP